MTWLGWLSQLVGMCPHAHSYKERDLQDRLGLRCEACHRWVPVNLPMGERGARLRRRMKTQGRASNVVEMRERKRA